LVLNKKKKELADLGNAVVPINWRHIQSIERDLDELLECEEIFWRQRSRVTWLREGDCNTKFFHAKASSLKKRNVLHGLFDAVGFGVRVTKWKTLFRIISHKYLRHQILLKLTLIKWFLWLTYRVN
jgi:hypothetical protein